jgi:hypothetical protein
MPLTPPPHASLRTGDLVVLRHGREHTEGYIIATLPDGQYKVERVTGLGYRDRITTVTADEIRRDSDTRVDRQMSSTSKANRFDFGDCGSPFQPVTHPGALTQPGLCRGSRRLGSALCQRR